MTIKDAFKKFFVALNGTEPTGNNISDVILNGSKDVEINNESALAVRTAALETAVGTLDTDVETLQTAVGTLDTDVETLQTICKFVDDGKGIELASSTADSVKKFKITVSDDGELTATEIVVVPPEGT